MGNENANSYWEAELPPNYDIVRIENFICAKYEEEQTSSQQRYTYTRNSENFLDERKKYQAPTTKGSISVPPKGPEPVAPIPVPQQVIQKSVPAVPPGESVKQVSEAVSPPKIDFATDLFNMLSTDDPSESGLEAPF